MTFTQTRLLTFTGPGGSGKTRLCIRLAAGVASDCSDGVYFVPVAPIRDAELLVSSIAQTIGLQDSRERPLIEHLTSYLQDRQVLLVLDNFEQLLAAGPVVAELLKRTTAVKVVVTSRAPLRISGEQEYSVPPLALPDPQTPVRSASECEAVRLFIDRARSCARLHDHRKQRLVSRPDRRAGSTVCHSRSSWQRLG